MQLRHAEAWIRQNAGLGKKAYMEESEANDDGEPKTVNVQWMTSDNTNFFPASRNLKTLTPGLYEIQSSMSGTYFSKMDIATEDLIKFPDTESDEVVAEIEKFWEEETKFRDAKLAYKRGILLYGPPGSGKTCTIKMILEDIIKRGGIALKFDDPHLFTTGMKIIREIQPSTPVVVLMEDIDSILQYNSESRVINVLDGVDDIDKCVFLATTNYPEKLGSRIMNRPSRFDKRFEIGMPSAQARRVYLQKKLEGTDEKVDKWVEDTDGMSIAHLKELIVAVTILDNKYDEALDTLKQMSKKVDSAEWDKFGDGETLAKAIRVKKEAQKKPDAARPESHVADNEKRASKWPSGWNSSKLPGQVFASRDDLASALKKLS